MKIVTAANEKFTAYLEVLERQCQNLKYDLEIFDLGGLGYGSPLPVDHSNFQQNGWYHQMHGDWRTKALHKPEVILQALKDEPIAYLDADAFPVKRFDEVWEKSFDVGVTLRCKDETSVDVLGPINAGVIFFRPSAKPAVHKWHELTQQVGNDQKALCQLMQNPEFKFHGFPARVYNYYRFPEMPPAGTKIYHFKEDPKVRPCFERITAELPE